MAQPETAEVILVEDGSPDNSWKVCQELAGKYENVHLYRHKDGKNRGAGARRNLGMKNSSYEYIAFLDADDYFLPGRFSVSKEIFASNPDCEGVYEAVDIHFDDEQAKQRWRESKMGNVAITTMTRHVPPEELFEKLKGHDAGYFSIIGLTIKRCVLEKSGYMNEKLKLGQGTVFINLLAAVSKLLPGSLKVPVSIRRVHGQNRIIAPQSEHKIYKNEMKKAKITYRWLMNNGYTAKSKIMFNFLVELYLHKVPIQFYTFIKKPLVMSRSLKLLLWRFEFPNVLFERAYWEILFPKGFMRNVFFTQVCQKN